MDIKNHWNSKYASADIDKLGWYEANSGSSFRLFESCELDPKAHIFIAGAGATLFVDQIIEAGYSNITVCDISEVALDHIKKRLGPKADQVHWLVEDLTCFSDIEKLESVDFWHDRAVLHFFTEPNDRTRYFELLKEKCSAGSKVMLAAFSKEEQAAKCSNLPVYKYDALMFLEALGKDFIELESFHELYTMPSGDERDYVYGLFQHIATNS